MKNTAQQGFTLAELMVSALILVVIFTFVLANFRSGQYSGELGVVIKQLTAAVNEAQGLTLGGQVLAGGFPVGGYGIHFQASDPQQIVIFADTDESGSYTTGEEISNRTVEFRNIEFVNFCSTDVASVGSVLPCTTPDWSAAGVSIDILFPVPGQVVGSYQNQEQSDTFLGGTLRHEKTGQQGYFYASLVNGVTSGGMLQ